MLGAKAGRIAAILLFVGLIGATLVLNRSSPSSGGAKPSPSGSKSEGPSRYGFRLEEVSKASGIDFVHKAPTLDAKLAHIMPQIASMGAGVSAVDFDRDGWQDLYVTNSGEGSFNRLYRNRKDGTFEDVAGPLGVADVNKEGTGVSMGSVWGDYDNDGYEDLFLYKWGRPELFHNDGGKAFTRQTESAGLPAWVNAGCATWLDFDRDGRLDLFLGGYWADDLDLWHLKTTKMMPESFEYAKNGGRKYLFRNVGDGRFEDAAKTTGLESRAGRCARRRPICEGPASPTWSSPTTTASRNSSRMRAGSDSARSATRRGSASRPRAA